MAERSVTIRHVERGLLYDLVFELGYWRWWDGEKRVDCSRLKRETFHCLKHGPGQPVFSDPRNDFKWGAARALPPSVKDNVRIWLCQRSCRPPLDMWINDRGSKEAWLAAVLRPAEPPPRRRLQYDQPSSVETVERNLSTVAGMLEDGDSWLYYHEASKLKAKEFIREASGIVQNTDDLRRLFPAVDRICTRHKSCHGCGKGAPGLKLLRPLFTAIADPDKTADIRRIGAPRDVLSLGRVQGHLLKDARINADTDGVKTATAVIDQIVWTDLVGYCEERSLVHLDMIVMDTPMCDDAFTKRLDRVAALFGPNSEEYVSVLKCRACQAVFADLGSEENERADEFLEIAWEACRRARAATSKSSPTYEDLVGHGFSLTFLELCRLEQQAGNSLSKLTRDLREKCGDSPKELFALRERVSSPIRRAMIDYWLWVHSRCTDYSHLQDAQVNLSRNPIVKSLCVLDVHHFRKRIDKNLAPLNTAQPIRR